ncbi:DUF6095 family protein [Paucihalobacter sp.]|uniref:DUF6095 family protein n=1 Tax=Paucihalobacter sp. TaxID=2850405 RepID=UPI002FE26BA6
METNRTDKEMLVKGIKIMVITALCMFIGPTLLYIAFANPEGNLYLITLIVGALICVTSLILAFYGLNTIMNSMFKGKK